VLTVEVKVIFSVFLAIFLLKLGLKLIASEASEEKKETIERFRHKKNHRSAAVGGARRVRPPPGSASDSVKLQDEPFAYQNTFHCTCKC